MNGREEKTSPLRLTWEAAMPFRADVVYILREFSCLVIAALLFPDMEQDPAIVAGARRSNVQVLWATDKLMGRVAEIAAGKDCRLATLETSAPGRHSRWATPPGGISHSQRPANRTRRRSKPLRPRVSGPKGSEPQRPSPTVASNPHFHIPIGAAYWELDRFHPYPRALAPLTG